jgi:hypothetical protein
MASDDDGSVFSFRLYPDDPSRPSGTAPNARISEYPFSRYVLNVSDFHLFDFLINVHVQTESCDKHELQQCHGDAEDDTCCLCLDNFGTCPCVKLGCSHVLHGSCWSDLKRGSSPLKCPLCRVDLAANGCSAKCHQKN